MLVVYRQKETKEVLLAAGEGSIEVLNTTDLDNDANVERILTDEYDLNTLEDAARQSMTEEDEGVNIFLDDEDTSTTGVASSSKKVRGEPVRKQPQGMSEVLDAFLQLSGKKESDTLTVGDLVNLRKQIQDREV